MIIKTHHCTAHLITPREMLDAKTAHVATCLPNDINDSDAPFEISQERTTRCRDYIPRTANILKSKSRPGTPDPLSVLLRTRMSSKL